MNDKHALNKFKKKHWKCFNLYHSYQHEEPQNTIWTLLGKS